MNFISFEQNRVLSETKKWISEHNYGVVQIIGSPGIGKSFLLNKIAEEYKFEFEFLIYAKLRETTVDELIEKIINKSSVRKSIRSSNTGSYLPCLDERSFLIVLDGFDELHPKSIPQYQSFFKNILSNPNNSYIVATSRKSFLEDLEIKKQLNYLSINLKGFSEKESLFFLESQGLQVSSSSVVDGYKRLIQSYEGSPLLLSLAAEVIKTKFDGDFSRFLTKSSNYNNVDAFLEEIFLKLSRLSQQIMYLLSIQEKSLDLEEIIKNIGQEDIKQEVKNTLSILRKQNLIIEENNSTYTLITILKDFCARKLLRFVFREEKQAESFQNEYIYKSIEFPPEYREAGTSILMYFNHVLKAQYPNIPTTVTIVQDGNILRMTIKTPDGSHQIIEETLYEYSLVVSGKYPIEKFFDDPYEVMALKNKLEIAHLELRQTKELLGLMQNTNQKRIESLETQVERLHTIIENNLRTENKTLEVIEKMTKEEGKSYDLRGAKFGGGFATEGGLQSGGTFIDVSSTNNLTDAAKQIQDLLEQLKQSGISTETSQNQVAQDLARQAENDPQVMGKLVQWGKSLADKASETTVTTAVQEVVKLSLRLLGIPLL